MSLSVGGSGKVGDVSAMLKNLRRKPHFRSFMIEQVKKDLGPMWEWLPDKSLSQNPNMLLKSETLVSSM